MLALAHHLEAESLGRSRRRMRRRTDDVRSAVGVEQLCDRNDARSFLLPRLESAEGVDEGVALGRRRIGSSPVAKCCCRASQQSGGGAEKSNAICVERAFSEL